MKGAEMRARKPYKCRKCGDRIYPGQLYIRMSKPVCASCNCGLEKVNKNAK